MGFGACEKVALVCRLRIRGATCSEVAALMPPELAGKIPALRYSFSDGVTTLPATGARER
jgi:hypothetical protein